MRHFELTASLPIGKLGSQSHRTFRFCWVSVFRRCLQYIFEGQYILSRPNNAKGAHFTSFCFKVCLYNIIGAFGRPSETLCKFCPQMHQICNSFFTKKLVSHTHFLEHKSCCMGKKVELRSLCFCKNHWVGGILPFFFVKMWCLGLYEKRYFCKINSINQFVTFFCIKSPLASYIAYLSYSQAHRTKLIATA